MKRILLITFFGMMTAGAMAQTGPGWAQQRSKVNFKDSINIANGLKVAGSVVYPANWNTAYTDRLKWDGGSTDLVAATGRTSLGATTVGSALFTLTNPSAITFPRINADNSVTALSATNFKTALSLAASDVGLGNVTNESKATMFTSPVFTGSVPTAGGIAMSRIADETASLTAGVQADVTLTGVTTKPYVLWITDSDGLDITKAVKDSTGISGGVYHVYIYSVDSNSNITVNALW
ncbi:MAG: hypothetical protein ABFC18_03460 [Rikenellaceae bacterium]